MSAKSSREVRVFRLIAAGVSRRDAETQVQAELINLLTPTE
ncbi:hypothetical protein [Paeniglutamicibacter terrestris]|nr:hypothetical protein [Paeniglutamicibacter terrestris]